MIFLQSVTEHKNSNNYLNSPESLVALDGKSLIARAAVFVEAIVLVFLMLNQNIVHLDSLCA